MSELLARIAAATRIAATGPLAADRERPPSTPLPVETSLAERSELVERFRAELERLTGKVYGPTDTAGAVAQVGAILRQLNSSAILAWDDASLTCPGLGQAVETLGIRMVRPDVPRDGGRQAYLEDLASFEVGLTGAQSGLADTGSVVVASGPGRARVASLLQPVHIALLPTSLIFATMADWLALDGAPLIRDSANVVVITGPSRTADIELVISLGVHGPREVHVVLLDDPDGAVPLPAQGRRLGRPPRPAV